MRYVHSFLFALALAFSFAVPAHAQIQLQDGAAFLGHAVVSGAPPVGTGCTITAGSTDMAGSCLTTAAAGSIAFSKAFATLPWCILQDGTATPLTVYVTTVAQITLTTVTSGHTLYWICLGRTGN